MFLYYSLLASGIIRWSNPSREGRGIELPVGLINIGDERS